VDAVPFSILDFRFTIDASIASRKPQISQALALKKETACILPEQSAGGINFGKLLPFLLAGGKRLLRGLRLGGALLEFVHASSGVHELLLAGIERVAHVANAHDDYRFGGAGLDLVATGATNLRVHILRMNVRLHKKGRKLTMKEPDDKREFAGNMSGN
jgi:hypothetical protein